MNTKLSPVWEDGASGQKRLGPVLPSVKVTQVHGHGFSHSDAFSPTKWTLEKRSVWPEPN